MGREPHKLLKGGTFMYTAIAEELGSANAGLFMSQLVWLCFDSKVAHKVGIGEWIYQTNEQIRAVTKLSRRELEYGRRIALKKGWVETIKKGIPAKTYYKVTQKFDDWCYTRPSDDKANKTDCDLQDAQNEQTERSNENHKSEVSIQGCAKRTVLTAQNAPCNKERYKESYKDITSLSDCEQSDVVANDFTADDFLNRWSELAKKYKYTSMRVVNSSLTSAFNKVNKIIRKEYLPDDEKPWDIYFKNVEAIMLEYLFFDFRKFFDPLYALRLTKQNDIIQKICNYSGTGWIPKDDKHVDIKTCRKLKETIREAIVGEKEKQTVAYDVIAMLRRKKKLNPYMLIGKRVKRRRMEIEESRERVRDLVEKQNELDAILQKEDES